MHIGSNAKIYTILLFDSANMSIASLRAKRSCFSSRSATSHTWSIVLTFTHGNLLCFYLIKLDDSHVDWSNTDKKGTEVSFQATFQISLKPSVAAEGFFFL
jgi:hypothetical protein